MAAVYSTLPVTGDSVSYTSATPSISYTDSNLISTFGPVHAPRIYAEELTALELASSGKIAYTLSDAHALDMLDGGDNTIYLRARDANSLKLVTESSNVFVTLDETNDDFLAYAANAVGVTAAAGALALESTAAATTVTAGTDFVATAANGVALTATASNIALAAGQAIAATAEAAVQIESTSSNVALGAGEDIQLSAASNVNLVAGTEISLSAPSWVVNADDVAFSAASNLTLTAGDVLTLEAADSNVVVNGGMDMLVTMASNISLTATGNNAAILAGADVSLESGAATTLVAATTASLTSTSNLSITSLQEDVAITADGNVTVRSETDGNLTMRAPITNKQIWQIGATDVMQLYKTDQFDLDANSNLSDYKLVVNADVEVAGTINSTSITETILEVEDKIIHLAFSSNIAAPSDGTTNEGAGIVVDGLPAGGDSNIYDRYEKSMRWHNGTGGVRALGDSNLDEAYWELRGGSLRIAHVNETTGDDLGFAFRLNQLNELELVKFTTPLGGATTAVRVAKFGRTIA